MPNTPARVLIVDDRPDMALILAKILEVSGFEPHVATAGPEALEIYAAVQPRVVLLDLGMPGMDGFEVCRRIRALPHSAAVLIVIISGYVQEEQRLQAIEAGADDYLLKPVDANKLVTMIRQHLGEG
jgi:two-component system, chemotaxis family, CheB/CheR fusion protein